MNKNIKSLYDEKLKYNCSFVTMKHNNSDLLLIYLGCNDFLIVSNYIGVVAVGHYRFNYDNNEAFITFEIIKDHYNVSTLEKIIIKYERSVMGLKCKINLKKEG